MKILTTAFAIVFFIFSGVVFADDQDLMRQSQEKMKEAQQQMEIIKKTEDLSERQKLLDKHSKTMQECNDLVLQIEVDPERGGKGQGTQVSDLMHERVRYLEHMMQQLLENQREQSKIDSN